MAAGKRDRDPPAPGRAAAIEARRVDPEHPKRPVPAVELSTRPLDTVVQDLKALASPDAPVVSAYWDVPADPGQLKGAVAALKDLAREVREGAASPDLSHAARESLQADADRLLQLEPMVSKLHGRTLALFRCHARGLEEAVAIPGGMGDRIMIDTTPFLRPLLTVLAESHRYAVAIVDREHGYLYAFYLGVLDAKETVHGRALREPNYAPGDKEYSVHHRAEELAKRHYRDTARALGALVQQEGTELLVVGGHRESMAAFSEELPSDLRGKVVGTFIIDPSTMTPGSVREAADRVVQDYERREEAELVEQALERVAAGGLGAVGLEWCLAAAVERAVDLLLVDAGAQAAGRVCDRCGWLGLDGGQCPVDGTPTRPAPDVIDEMAGRVLDSRGRVEHVKVETPLRPEQVAAFLRYPVARPDPAPA